MIISPSSYEMNSGSSLPFTMRNGRMNDAYKKLDAEWQRMSWSMREKEIEKVKDWIRREDPISFLIKEMERSNDLKRRAKF